MSDYVVQMKGITKTFPGVKALDNIELQVRPGEVHALMGENGAGKSTLMKILSGLYQPDKGEFIYEGKIISIEKPSDALKIGISMIYQELSSVQDMSIAENIFLGREPKQKNKVFIDFKKMDADAKEMLELFKMPLKSYWKMKRLSTAQKQMIEIIKAMSLHSKVIVMDEPTSSLTKEEVKTLFNKIHELKNTGVAIIYISHRLEEIFEIGDVVTVLRDGQFIGKHNVCDLDKNKLISLMVGRELTNVFPKVNAEIKEIKLAVKGLKRKGVFTDIDFHVRKGEILGVYGLVGSGRSEIMRAIFGIDSYDEGRVILEGKPLNVRNPRDAIKHGIAMVTEDRKELGLVLCRTIKENIVLANLSAYSMGPFVNSKQEEKDSKKISEQLKTKMNGINQLVENLSGGNQQKVVLSKWLIKNPKVLILDEPTRGIDIAAKAEIYTLMGTLVKRGLSIIMISSELPEIIGMSDRVIVIGDGNVQGEFIRDQLSQEQLLHCALGGAV